MLEETASWLIKEQNSLNLALLPQVFIDPQQIELKDGVYDTETSHFSCNITNRSYSNTITACCYGLSTSSFEDLPFPETTVDFVLTYCETPLQFMYSFSLLFYSNLDETPKTLCLWGEPSSGKTLLLDTLLTAIFSRENVGKINFTSSRFQLADLTSSWITIINDFRLADYQRSLLMNLLEGNDVFVEEKFKGAKKETFSRAVITTNEDLEKAYSEDESLAAFMRRLTIVRMKASPSHLTPRDRVQLKQKVLSEAVSFVVFSALFRDQYFSPTTSLPRKWCERLNQEYLLYRFHPRLTSLLLFVNKG